MVNYALAAGVGDEADFLQKCNQPAMSEPAKRHWLVSVFDAAAEISGASAGAAIGTQSGDPVLSAAVGAGIAHTIKSVGHEIEQRLLAPRERARLTGAAQLIVRRIKANYDEGKRVRDDAFFEPSADGRAASEEIFESTMLAIQRDAEEKKLELYSNLVANIAFDSSVSQAFANHMITLAERLTYRQLCMIALFGGDTTVFDLRGSFRGYKELVTWEQWSVLQEMFDLCRLRLLNNRDGSAYIDIVDINPAGTALDGVANKMFQLMNMPQLRGTGMRSDIERLSRFLQ